MRKITWLVLWMLAVWCLQGVAFAASPWTQETTYGGKVRGKLDFGFKNTLAGWTELVTESRDAYNNKTNIFTGIGRGIVNSAAYTAGGILHLATFPLTNLDVPLPDNGVSFS